jgi:hypothetical protein
VEEALDQLARRLERTDRMLADLGPRVAPLSDSLMAVLAGTRRTLTQVKELAQVSRRPTRFLTGVEPPSLDTNRKRP